MGSSPLPYVGVVRINPYVGGLTKKFNNNEECIDKTYRVNVASEDTQNTEV